jgi:hypothetical protein
MNRPMIRPKYETSFDLAEEDLVKEIIESHFAVSCVKLQPMAYFIDFALVCNGTINGWVEVKCRQHPVNQYATFMVSLNKIAHGMRYARATKCPFFLFVKWSDCVGYMTVDQVPFSTIGGRSDRFDPHDIEPLAHFPIEQFQIIKQLKG